MAYWVHQDNILDDEELIESLQEAWEHEGSKDELKIELQGLERLYWLGTEAGRQGCYDSQGETWAGDPATGQTPGGQSGPRGTFLSATQI